MADERDFRFSFNIFTIGSRESFVRSCRVAERHGYDVAFAADHLGAPAPFTALATAAEATKRLRVGTLVLNVAFWNPHLLAREVATIDRLTEGRFELGLGAGHVRAEFDAAGVPWQSLPDRVRRVEEVIGKVRDVFGGAEYTALGRLPEPPEPLQRSGAALGGPPLLVGGASRQVLALAARQADTVSVIGVSRDHSDPRGGFLLAPPEQTERQVTWARQAAGPRTDRIEWHTMVQYIAVTDNRRAAAEELIRRMMPTATVEQVLNSPFILIGTVTDLVEQLRATRERYGFSHFTVHRPFLGAFAPVVERLRAEQSSRYAPSPR
jgi:probable F420-dependent oxidoreductase